jgi:hypothetical protein
VPASLFYSIVTSDLKIGLWDLPISNATMYNELLHSSSGVGISVRIGGAVPFLIINVVSGLPYI